MLLRNSFRQIYVRTKLFCVRTTFKQTCLESSADNLDSQYNQEVPCGIRVANQIIRLEIFEQLYDMAHGKYLTRKE